MNAPPVFSTAWETALREQLHAASATRKAANRQRRGRRGIWTLDCETDPFEKGVIPEPFLWGLYDGEHDEYHQFDTAAELVEFIADKEILIYAHNGGHFDYHYLKSDINGGERIMVINGRLARFKIGKAELRDSVNLIPAPLADFQKSKVDYNIFRRHLRDRPENRRIIELYLKSDCVNLYNVVREFLTRFGSHLTQAGASMKYWSTHYNVEIPRQSAARYRELKPYYYGGRVQCFAQGYGERRFKVLDINSAYPYAMIFKHPYSTSFDVSRTLPTDRAQLETSLIRLIAVSKGAFPLRDAKGDLYFPEDERKGREYTVTGWEYLAGIETGTLQPIRIKEVRTFDQLIDFGPYVAEFYEQRQTAKATGDRASDIFAKIFLNSLYGKFAANPTKYKEFLIAEPDTSAWCNARGENFEPMGLWDGERSLLVRDLPEWKHRYYNLATAASITGFVRAYLWRAIQQCRDVLYCDTDSIAARDTGSLALGGDLGAWKLEMDCDRYAIAGKKLYAFHDIAPKRDPKTGELKEWKVASKGVKLTADEIVAIAKGGRHEYVPEIPTYSVHRAGPMFIPREIVATAKDIRKFPVAPGRPTLRPASPLVNVRRAA